MRAASLSIFRRLAAIVCTLSIASVGHSAEPDYTEIDHLQVALEYVYDSGLYQGQDGYWKPEPYFHARKGRLFAEGQTFGWDMFVGNKASLSLAVARNHHELDIDTIKNDHLLLYQGLTERKRAWELALIYKYQSRVGLLSFEYYKDYGTAHDGIRTTTRLTRPIPNNGGITIEPSLFVHFNSREFNRYYYGVTENENEEAAQREFGVLTKQTLRTYEKTIRDVYTPKNSAHLGVDVRISMPLQDNFSLTGYLSYMDVTGPLFRSPLVEDRKYYNANIGLAYTF